jgi:hypothetical protein
MREKSRSRSSSRSSVRNHKEGKKETIEMNVRFGSNIEHVIFSPKDNIAALAHKLAKRNSKLLHHLDLPKELEDKFLLTLKDMLNELNKGEVAIKAIETEKPQT